MTPPLDERTRVTVSTSVYVRSFGDEVVLLEFGNGEYFGLDAIGAEIWRRLEAGDDLGAVADHLAAHYEVSRAVAFNDVAELVGRLRSHALITSP